MPEPEELILEGVHIATSVARDLWHRHVVGEQPSSLTLAHVQQGLELFNTALFGETPPIVAAEPPALPTWLARVAKRIPRHLIERDAYAWTDGERLRLPPSMGIQGMNANLVSYRLLAIGQALRASRGSAVHMPDQSNLLLHDLFLISEAVAVNCSIASMLPGMLTDLITAQTTALALRPERVLLTPVEWEIEQILRAVLSDHPASPHLPYASTPVESLAWAQEQATRLQPSKAQYRGLPRVQLWGSILPAPQRREYHTASPSDAQDNVHAPRAKTSQLRRRPRVREAAADEDDQQMGMLMVRIDAPEESIEDPMGLQRPIDRDQHADPNDLADSLADLPEARIVHTPGASREILLSSDPPERSAQLYQAATTTTGIFYPEWDWRQHAYHAHGVLVHEATAQIGDSAWVGTALKRHARLIQQVRRHFERLRPQRARLGRQTDGPEIDLLAYVDSYADRLAGSQIDDRLYAIVRPARRPIAITLLVDVSASTDSWVNASLRIIDVEKEALLIVCEALDLLGDHYSIMAFSGTGPQGVVMRSLKHFREHNDMRVRQRIAALEPEHYTRLGAALRHSTTLLAREAAWHRLLLILSDGKPNDIDTYEGRYGIEDTRQAIAEARLQGITPFCLTIDRQPASYLTRMYGPGAYAVLRHAEHLPLVLVELIRRLIKS